MLTTLSIRDIVLIEKLDLELEPGMTVLTGETGAGKSILLDALGLALGARGDASLVRSGRDKGHVTAAYSLPSAHPAMQFLRDNDISTEGELVVKRVQAADGGSKASINGQPVSMALLRQLSTLLIELHGQHADRALVNVSSHRALLDAFGGLEEPARVVSKSWQEWTAKRSALQEHIERMNRADVERDYLEHAVKELAQLAPVADEEEQLASRRQLMMQAEQFVAAIDETESVLRGDAALESRLNAALRRMERRKEQAAGRLDQACAAVEQLLQNMSEANDALENARQGFVFDPRELEKSEERLFALRAAARKFRCTVQELPSVQQKMTENLAQIENGAAHLKRLEQEETALRTAYEKAADTLSAKRLQAAKTLSKAVMKELPVLKLERAQFETTVESDAAKPSASGIDRVEFKVATNPGADMQPLMKIASGGELARFMLALKVVLAAKGSAPVLIFDEIDTGVGGAVAEAIGKRLRHLSKDLQIIAVTHSPQVAAQANAHLLIAKKEDKASRMMVTSVESLSREQRQGEVARMLSGDTVTSAARTQAQELLAGAA